MDERGTGGVVLVGEQSGRTTHYVDCAEVAAAALGRSPRALCRRTFAPAALVSTRVPAGALTKVA